jgi:hypothetical protein
VANEQETTDFYNREHERHSDKSPPLKIAVAVPQRTDEAVNKSERRNGRKANGHSDPNLSTGPDLKMLDIAQRALCVGWVANCLTAKDGSRDRPPIATGKAAEGIITDMTPDAHPS